MKEPTPISLDGVRRYPLAERSSTVSVEHFGTPWQAGGTVVRWLESLPRILAGKDLLEIADRIVEAAAARRTVMLAMGAHAVKVGLNPVIIDLVDRGIISSISLNGAGVIHDTEVAMVGCTSEDVAAEIGTGRFGMAEETGKVINEAIVKGAADGMGLGKAVGAMLVEAGYPFNEHSLLARAYERRIPVTVHVAIGTDIIHCHPAVDGAAIGAASHLDFRLFARLVSTLNKGVYLNVGSAVILPEVFLKALSLVRNLGHDVQDITTVNMDFIRHYRPMTNVVHRPTLDGGRGYSLVGHHEIMLPLLAAAIVEGMEMKGETDADF